ncbi:hypothetical protein C8R31_103330 [Nitrosospira sp. Nsp2]|nr:hypothetical protein C8R31_103330 [Nitrosospira sp. Nsp2]
MCDFTSTPLRQSLFQEADETGLSNAGKGASIMTGRVANSKAPLHSVAERRQGFQGMVAAGIRRRMMPVFFSNQGVLRLRS